MVDNHETRPMEFTGDQFADSMDIAGPICLDAIQVIIRTCIESRVTPVLGLVALIELTERNLKANRPDLPEGVDDGWDQLRIWVQNSIDDHLSDEPENVIKIPLDN